MDNVLNHLRSRAMERLNSMNSLQWAGIAAGAGLGLGIIGRVLRNRSRSLPHVIVIERVC